MNMVTHIVGGAMAIVITLLCLCKSVGSPISTASCAIYGGSMTALYAVSSVYHGLRAGTGKKVMQVIDHCTIYFLIAGTYTPIMLLGFIDRDPVIGWGLLALEWGLSILACVLTAIDLRRYKVFSMFCYILTGWAIIFFIPQAIAAFQPDGFLLLLSGGISYSIGAICFGFGRKVRWMHAIFHIFVVLGSFLQFLSIYLYIL